MQPDEVASGELHQFEVVADLLQHGEEGYDTVTGALTSSEDYEQEWYQSV